jgi:predicted transcriptional regulator
MKEISFPGGSMEKKILVELTAEIVSAHASVNEMSREELLEEIQAVFQKLNALSAGEVEAAVAPSVEKPAVPLSDAFGNEKVHCMICGKGFTTLKKHLAIAHNLAPKEYRKRFNIPSRTPLVARNYSEAKKKIAQKLGLAEKLAEGRRRRAK